MRSAVGKYGALYHNGGSNPEEIIQRVYEIARWRKWLMSYVALAWLGRHVTASIIVFGSVERSEDALAAGNKLLTEAEEFYLEEL